MLTLSRNHVDELRILRIRHALYNDRGFYPRENPQVVIEWNSVLRVAAVFEIDAVALESENYWAFQTRDPLNTFWVLYSVLFDEQIAQRFGTPSLPHSTKWNKVRTSGGELYSYIVWPHTEIGAAMYAEVKKRVWELGRKIAYSRDT